jgi:hypothetical protein
MDPQTMTKDERSCLVYLETCVVDASGLVQAQRMNQADFDAIKKFEAEGLLKFGRIPAILLRYNAPNTHWCTFNPPAWELVSKLRQMRAQQIGPKRKAIDDALREMWGD